MKKHAVFILFFSLIVNMHGDISTHMHIYVIIIITLKKQFCKIFSG